MIGDKIQESHTIEYSDNVVREKKPTLLTQCLSNSSKAFRRVDPDEILNSLNYRRFTKYVAGCVTFTRCSQTIHLYVSHPFRYDDSPICTNVGHPHFSGPKVGW